MHRLAVGLWSSRAPSRPAGDALAYAAAVLVGAVLIVIAAIRQPFSYDELTQITPYGSDDLGTITGATRQPPLDPLLGALFQHLFGEGQLRQRLVPVLAGIGVLVLMSLLLRRLGLRYAGAAAVLVMATGPLMVRYAAYTRPYELPMFFMMLAVYAAQRWLDDRARGWLVVTALAAFALPLIRVPEPTVFLVASAATLAWFTHRGRLTWSQSWPLIAISLAAVLSMGLTQYFSLASSANGFFDPSPSGVIDRFGTGVHELRTAFVPLLGDSFPWWPLLLLVLVLVVVIPVTRRRLFGWAPWWPLLAAPVAFAIAYHFVNPFPFDAIPYRARAASFFVPPLTLAVAALASVVERGEDVSRRVRVGVAVLLGAVLVGQLPATARVLRNDAAPDFRTISQVLTTRLPDDAIVIYDRPTPAGASRQPFLGTPRYMGSTPYVQTLVDLPRHVDELPTTGPVYLLFNGQCAYHGRCVPGSRTAVHVSVPGWRIAYQRERFTIYAPTEGQSGTAGVAEALTDFGDALGPELGYLQTYAAAAVLEKEGKADEGRALIDGLMSRASPELAALIRKEDDKYHIDPFAD